MVKTLVKFGTLFVKFLKTYPAAAAVVVNIGVMAAGYFGLDVTGDQLIYYFGIITTLLGMLVHMNVVPLVRVAEQSAEKELKAEVEHVIDTPDRVIGNILADIAKEVQAK